jgi:hypothetical protein
MLPSQSLVVPVLHQPASSSDSSHRFAGKRQHICQCLRTPPRSRRRTPECDPLGPERGRNLNSLFVRMAQPKFHRHPGVVQCTWSVTAGTHDTVELGTGADPEFDLVVSPDLRRDDVVFSVAACRLCWEEILLQAHQVCTPRRRLLSVPELRGRAGPPDAAGQTSGYRCRHRPA